jgi:hypothetical protein
MEAKAPPPEWSPYSHQNNHIGHPIYTTISIELPPWLLKVLCKIRIAFLWVETEVVQGGKCLVSWDQVQRPLSLGGLGVLDLRMMGMSLRLHWLWL